MLVQMNERLLKTLMYVLPLFFVAFTLGLLILLFKDFLTLPFVLIAVLVSEVVVIVLLMTILARARYRIAAVEADKQELLAFGDRYLHLYRSSPVPYIHVNSEGIITLSNVAARRLFNSKEHKLVGRSIFDYINHPDETTKSIITNKITSRTTFSDEELVLRTEMGVEKWVSVSGHTYSKNEDMFVTLIDVTQKKKVDKAKTEFVSLAAHQLRTPLSSANMALGMLEELVPEKTPQQVEYFGMVRSSLQRLLVLVDDFLSVSKFETGSFATAVTDVALHEEIPEIIKQYEVKIREKRINAAFSMQPEQMYIKLDKRLLRMVVGNLISNATKYNRERGDLTIRCFLVGEMIQISVADTGLGIPLEDQQKIFTKFHRAQNVQLAHIKGNGLGLYIVKEAVALMGGTVSFESEENKGTTFVVSLPVY